MQKKYRIYDSIGLLFQAGSPLSITNNNYKIQLYHIKKKVLPYFEIGSMIES